MEASGRVEIPLFGISIQPAPQEDSSNCFSRTLSTIVDCLCWIWETFKQFLALVTCNLCFSPAEPPAPNTSTPPAAAPTARQPQSVNPYPNLKNREHIGPLPPHGPKRFLIELIPTLYRNLSADYPQRLTPAIEKLFSFLERFEILEVTFETGPSKDYIKITTRDTTVADSLKALPGLRDHVWTYKDHPATTSRCIIKESAVFAYKDDIFIDLYDNNTHRPVTAWMDAMEQWQPPTPAAPSLNSFKAPLIDSIVDLYQDSRHAEYRPKIEYAVEQIFNLLAPYEVSGVSLAKLSQHDYIVIRSTTSESSNIKNTLEQVPSLGGHIHDWLNPPRNELGSWLATDVHIRLRRDADWWDSFQQPQTSSSTTLTHPEPLQPPVAAPPSLDSFKAPVLEHLHTQYDSNMHPHLDRAIDRIFTLIAPFEIVDVNISQQVRSIYLLIETKSVEARTQLETALEAIPSLKNNIYNWKKTPPNETGTNYVYAWTYTLIRLPGDNAFQWHAFAVRA